MLSDDVVTRSVRVRITVRVVLAIVAAGLTCLLTWPVTEVPIDREQTPYFGRYGFNSFLLAKPAWVNTTGQRLAHRIGVLLVAGIAAIAVFGGARRLASFAISLPVRLAHRGGRWACVLTLLFVAWLTVPWIAARPDFSSSMPDHISLVTLHYSQNIGVADRLAAGDVMFRDTTPQYGVIFPTLLAAWERYIGVVSYGNVIRIQTTLLVSQLLLAMALYIGWARGRWVAVVLATLVMFPWYYVGHATVIAPNMTPWRMFGLPVALLTIWLVRRAPQSVALIACGAAAAGAVMFNTESGLAAAAGVAVYCGLRYGTLGGRVRLSRLNALMPWLALGALVAVGCWLMLYRIALGVFPDLTHIGRAITYLKMGASGLYGDEYKWELLPAFLFLHVAAVLVYTVLGPVGGFRPAFRAAVCTMFLIWFSYYVAQPFIHSSASYMFLYGFLIVDAARTVLTRVGRSNRVPALQAAVAGASLIVVLPVSFGAVKWSWNPDNWEVRPGVRWEQKIVRAKDATYCEHPVRISGLYLYPDVAKSVQERADFLRAKANGRRVIYFSPDAFLIVRVSGVVSKQEYCDLSEAVDRAGYLRVFEQVITSGDSEVYMDARDETKLVWSGGIFRLFRTHLAAYYRLDRVESGWEIWVRRDNVPNSAQ